METVIKYENCDEMYPDLASGTGTGATGEGTSFVSGADIALKRTYSEVNNGPVAVDDGSYYMNAQNQEQYRDFYATAAYQQQLLPVSLKRYRKNPDHVPTIFRTPFFELLQEDQDGKPGVVTARCRSCKVELRGHKNVSSNFIKHMKRGHPEIYKIYENIKMLRRGPLKDNADIEQAYLDASTLLEHLNAPPVSYDEEHHSETTDHSITTPPNHAEASEALENSTDALQSLSAQAKGSPISKEHGKVDLSNQTLERMSSMLDDKLKHFVSKTEFNETTKILANLMERRNEEKIVVSAKESSKESGCVPTELHSELSSLQQECRELRTAMRQAQQSKRQLQREMQNMHRTLHGNKLIIHNVRVDESQQLQEAVEQFLRERLELGNISLRSVTLLSVKNKKHSLRVELANETDAKTIFKNCYKLKNTGIYLEPELSLWTRKRKAKLLVLRKELLRRQSEIKVCVRDAVLIVAGKRFYWDEVEGLCSEHVEHNESLDGAAYLKTLTGLDLREFLNVLKHYDVQMR